MHSSLCLLLPEHISKPGQSYLEWMHDNNSTPSHHQYFVTPSSIFKVYLCFNITKRSCVPSEAVAQTENPSWTRKRIDVFLEGLRTGEGTQGPPT